MNHTNPVLKRVLILNSSADTDVTFLKSTSIKKLELTFMVSAKQLRVIENIS